MILLYNAWVEMRSWQRDRDELDANRSRLSSKDYYRSRHNLTKEIIYWHGVRNARILRMLTFGIYKGD